MTEAPSHLRINEETPAYWRAAFDNTPLSIMGPRWLAPVSPVSRVGGRERSDVLTAGRRRLCALRDLECR